jgi:hypothetical protein
VSESVHDVVCVRREVLPRAVSRAEIREMIDADRDHWDAVSYASTFSNTEHHPAVIGGPRSARRRASKPVMDAPVASEAAEVVRFRLSKVRHGVVGACARNRAAEWITHRGSAAEAREID